jgi:small-conductance mechanosensitive channel
MKVKEYLTFWNNIGPHVLVETGLTLLLIVIFFIVRKIISRLIRKHGLNLMHSKSRVAYVVKLSNFGLSLIFITLIAIVWEVSIKGLSIYFASFFTIVGVAFFASWSLLSNVTAYTIIFFYFPFKIGSTIRIIDGENSVEGKVDDITFFFIKIKLPTGEKVTYPNNIAIQKPIKVTYPNNIAIQKPIKETDK